MAREVRTALRSSSETRFFPSCASTRTSPGWDLSETSFLSISPDHHPINHHPFFPQSLRRLQLLWEFRSYIWLRCSNFIPVVGTGGKGMDRCVVVTRYDLHSVIPTQREKE